jgi:Cu/Ag efflux pump CusA
MAGVAGLGRPQLTMPSEQPNIEVAINDRRAHDSGALPGDARRQASTLVNGLTVGNFFEDQAVFDVVVVGTPDLRRNVQDVGGLRIDTASGRQVRLSDIARVSVRPDPIDIQHQALSRYVDVTAPVRRGSAGDARAAIGSALARVHFPLGYHAEVLGGTPEDPTSHTLFVLYVLAAAIGVLLLLQAAFAGWRLACAFLLTSPVALTGGLVVALATGEAASLGADAGLLAVLVLAIRLGVPQVVAVRRLRESPGERIGAGLVTRAAAERLAPSLQAIAVIAVVLIPFVVLGDVAGNEIVHTTAAVVLGGLVTAAAWSLLLVPGLCLAFPPGTQEPLAEALEDIDLVGLTAPAPDLVVKGKP